MAGRDETFFEEIKRYVGFGDADGVALQKLLPHAKPYFGSIADEFYERIAQHPAAARVFSGPEQVDRLKHTMQGWLGSLLTGPWDESYYEQRARIGHVHVKVNLPQRYMFTAMGVIRLRLGGIARTAFEHDAVRRDRVARALSKICDLELAIMLETYREEYLARVQHMERRAIAELETELANTEARYMTIVENAAALVIAIDVRGAIITFNSTAEAVTGFERTEVLGTDGVTMLTHPDSVETVNRNLSRLADGKPVPPFDSRLRTKQGGYRWVRWHITTLGASDDRMTVGVGIDVTEERELATRTRRAEQLAGLGTLAAGLAHEIRNPLNAANLQLMLVERRLAREGDDNRRSAADAARVVKTELERLAVLVQDFLAFARPTELRVSEGDLRTTVEIVATLLEPIAAEHGIALTTEVPDAPVGASFDEERIKQVLINLVRNAFDATGSGGAVCMRLERHGEDVLLTIEDDGPGVPAGVNIFEPFATSKESGTGLGLPIVHRIVTDHHGHIDYHRAHERTIFAVRLPIAGP